MATHAMRNSNPAQSDPSWASLDTSIRLSALMLAAGERLFKLQQETFDDAFAQYSRYLSLPRTQSEADAMIEEWPGLLGASAQRFANATQVYFEIVTQMQVEMARCLSSGAGRAEQPQSGRSNSDSSSTTDRRRDAMVIQFPDRRVALAASVDALVGRAGMDKAGSNRHRAA